MNVIPEDRLVFVVGAPRSGTTFFAKAIGSMARFVDLGEVAPLKAAIPSLFGEDTAIASDRIRQILEEIRRRRGVGALRGVEQTPEMAFLVQAVVHSYPRASIVHLIRDGRDVVSSLLEQGWLRANRSDTDEVGAPFGAYARFWVEPSRKSEFERVSEARRAAWAWRRYVSAASGVVERIEVRYEDIAAKPQPVAATVARHLRTDVADITSGLDGFNPQHIGRWQSDLGSRDLRDVFAEAGNTLRHLGYAT